MATVLNGAWGMASPSVQIRVEGGGGRGRGGATPGLHRLTRNKGLRKSVGRRSSEPSTNASIPSRYQAFFYASSEAKGFNSQASRFQEQLNVNETPGPGSYSAPLSCLNTYTTSTSKAGRGGFASKSCRFPGERTTTHLGPGSYDPHLLPHTQDFSYANVSRFFQKPITVKSEDGGNGFSSPSPTSYHPSHSHTEHNHLITAQAAFKSRSERTSLPLSSFNAPSPGHYHVRDDLQHPTPSPHFSVFTSSSSRDGLPKPPKGPGPADYNPHPLSTSHHSSSTTDQRQVAPYHRQKYYLRISAPAIPLPPLPPSPGPGHYETTQTPSQPVKNRQSACGFSSNADRWGEEAKNHRDTEPGPGTYDPETPVRKSFFYNTQSKWI